MEATSREMNMDDLAQTDEKLRSEISSAFYVAIRRWPSESENCQVEADELPSSSAKNWEFKRELVEQVGGFPLMLYWLKHDGDWRLIAGHGPL